MIKFYTSTGMAVGFGPGEFRQEHVSIEDIARHLAQIARFGGAGRRFYSVLKHSLLVGRLVCEPWHRQALLHDSAEAYIGDHVSPLKQIVCDLKELEERFTRIVFESLGILWPSAAGWAIIHDADRRAFAAESRLVGPPGLWQALGKPRDRRTEALLTTLLTSDVTTDYRSFTTGCASSLVRSRRASSTQFGHRHSGMNS